MVSSARRILALWFPRLPTDRLQRPRRTTKHFRASPDESPLVIAAKTGNALRITACDAKAASLGLRSGMPLADARAMVPTLDVAQQDEAADRRLLESIAEWSLHYTPLVALDCPDMLLLDVTGATHLFGGERRLLDRARTNLSRQGFQITGAIAGSAAAARALARYRDGMTVPPGEETRAMAPLPIEALALDSKVTQAFRHAGLKTIGQVAMRQRAELTARFGASMVFALDNALGVAEKPISPRAPLPDYMAERIFAEPLVAEDAIFETIRGLAQSLGTLLAERGEGARRLEAVFFRADGKLRRIAVEIGTPMRDADVIARLFRERLDALTDPLDPGFGFDLIRLSADRAERCDAGTAAFTADLREEKEMAFLVDRLAARFGSHRVLVFRPNDTHIPEAAALALPAQGAEKCKSVWNAIRGKDEAPRRPLRLFARPEPVTAIFEVPEAPPVRFRWRRAWHEVVLAEGPERIAMEWWRNQVPEPTRDYFRVEDSLGRRFWLYRDGLYGDETAAPRWFMHGFFA